MNPEWMIGLPREAIERMAQEMCSPQRILLTLLVGGLEFLVVFLLWLLL